MKKSLTILVLFLCFLLCALLLSSCALSPEEREETNEETTAIPEHEHVWDEGTVTKEGSCDPATKEETKGEITYTCTVCGETRTEETDGHKWDEGSVRVSPTCTKEGLKLYTCAVCDEKRGESVPVDPTAHTAKAGDKGRIVTPPTATSNGELEVLCGECGAGIRKAKVKYADYSALVNSLKTEIGQFVNSDFSTGNVTANLGTAYATPSVSPKKNQHPRVLFTKNEIAAVEGSIHELRSKDAVNLYMTYIGSPLTTGAALPTGKNEGYSSELLYKIQALALDYTLTKNEISGYGAVRAMMNYLKNMSTSWTMNDSCRNYGMVMYTAACVYDWCYDLLTPENRTQIVLGVQKKCCGKMEVGFPPSDQGAIAGHGTELQILRDYLAFAIAIYDEYPGWWNYIGGRFYADFVPVRNEFYKAGMYPQGVSLYVRVRYASDLYSAWLVKAATGVFPYASEADMKQVMRTVYAYELPNGNAFETGDNHTEDAVFQDYGRLALISSYLFNDRTIRAELEYHRKSYTSFSETITMSATVAEYLICSSNGVTAAQKRHTDMPLIQYNGGWLGQIIARNNWGDNQAAVLMKIGQRTSANHDHADAGQFQIWYKTMLAGDTGAYDKYGDTHFKKYHQATIAHNSLLIGGAGQKQPGETGNFNNGGSSAWLTSDTYKTGTVNGYAWGYADGKETSPTYAYVAGNITPAYNGAASEVTRRMLAVYDTKNDNIPLFFFVFDNITVSSASTKKTFLLHVPVEPTVSGNTVTVTKSGARLTLQSVFGGDSITKVGGTNNNYNVNGTQINPTNNGNDGFWGRVEISPNTGSKTNQLLNVMYVTDSDKTLSLSATAISNDAVKGAKIGKVTAVFVTSATRRSTPFNFTSAGTGNQTYYVSGVKAGNWTVSAGGSTQTVTATEDGGLLVFTAPAGTVTLTPQ